MRLTIKAAHLDHNDSSSIKIALCQIFTEAWAIQDNYQRTLDAINLAAAKGANIEITPECVLQGYLIGDNYSYRPVASFKNVTISITVNHVNSGVGPMGPK